MNAGPIRVKFFQWCKDLVESKQQFVKDFSVDTAKTKAEAKSIVSWLYGEFLLNNKTTPTHGGGGFGGFGGGIRS
jgi:hypothetical protein